MPRQLSKKAAAAEIQRLVDGGQTAQEVIATRPDLAIGLNELIKARAKPRGSGALSVKTDTGIEL